MDKSSNFWYVMCRHLDSKQLLNPAWKASGNLAFLLLMDGWRIQCPSQEVMDDLGQ